MVSYRKFLSVTRTQKVAVLKLKNWNAAPFS